MAQNVVRAGAILLILLSLSACDDDLSRRATDDHYQGSVDPDAEAIELRTLRGVGQPPLDLILVGDIRIDSATQRVSFDVALRNIGSESLMAPVAIRLGEFRPEEVIPFNADWLGPLGKFPNDPDYPWAFVYDDEFGSDGLLEPDETSATREWIFFDPGLGAFSFGARGELSGTPSDPAITGTVFLDANFNGQFDDFEMPYGVGAVHSTAADGTTLIAPVMSDGRYRFAVARTGLYELSYDDFTDGPWCTSTPNPLVVVVPPGEDGQPLSYDGADFGYSPGCGPEPDAVIYTDRPLEEFRGDPYQLIEARAEGNTLVVRAGFSGCGPEHPITLVVSNSIMESQPPQVFAVLQHESFDEICLAIFEVERRYDLTELVGRVNGPIYIRLLDYLGIESTILVGGMPDGS